MTSARLALLTVLLAAATAGSAEPDGAVAGPLRWPDPRGAPSGSRRSMAYAVTRVPALAWEFRPDGLPITAPPVHWEGRLYLLGGIGGDQTLFGLDLLTGQVLAKKKLNAPVIRPVVWDQRVFLRTALDEITVLRPVGKSFNRVWRWKSNVGELSDPLVFEGEIYTTAANILLRLREGQKSSVWATGIDDRFEGRPALYGDHVYVLVDRSARRGSPTLRLHAFDRRTGRCAGEVEVAPYHARAPTDNTRPFELTVMEDRVFISSPKPLAAVDGAMHNAAVTRRLNRWQVHFGTKTRLYNFAASPAVHREGLLVLSGDNQLSWVLWRAQGGAMLANDAAQPDFFRQRIAPTVLGDVAYFGTWAADIKTLDVLWRLPFERLRFPAVPADRMVVVVDDKGGVSAFR